MGLFSALHHHPSTAKPTRNSIYVLIRSQQSSDETNASARDASWSLCVEQSPAHHDSHQPQLQELHKTKSLFHMKRQKVIDTPSTNQAKSNPGSRQSSPQRSEYVEFNLQDGQLQTSPPSSTIDSALHPPPYSTTADQSPPPTPNNILLKLRLPQSPPNAQSTPSPLSTQIEHLLNSTQTSFPDSTNNPTTLFIRAALLTLQNAHILPSPSRFNVQNFISYAETKFSDLLTAEKFSHHQSADADATAHHVHELDYQAHLDEMARLREIFGHHRGSYDDAMAEAEDNETAGHGLGHSQSQRTQGHWWVDRPTANTLPQQQRIRYATAGSRDPYGGLM